MNDQTEAATNERAPDKVYKGLPENITVYTHLAHALARGYTDLYYVNMETDEFIEFHTDDESGVLSEARRGNDFFEGCERDARPYVYKDDQDAFITAMHRDFLEKALDGNRVYQLIYRRIKGGAPFYVQMEVSRMEDDPRFIVIAVEDIDEKMRQRREEERIREERIIYARLHALTGNFICVYVVDPETNAYREFSSTDIYEKNMAQEKKGVDFFEKVREVARKFNHRDDLKRFLSVFTKENILSKVQKNGIFTLGYRLMMNGKPIHVQMKAAMVVEKEGPRLVVGLNDIDAQVRQEEELERRITAAQMQANLDAMTGVKNRHAFIEAETNLDRQIIEQRNSPFAIVFFDVNELKKINDTAGHQAGDQYLRDACSVICGVFSHSPVFRVGGDEFAVIAQGDDYEHIEELVGKIRDHNDKAARNGGVIVACGMAKYDNDDCVASVFKRADQSMYDNKTLLKNG